MNGRFAVAVVAVSALGVAAVVTLTAAADQDSTALLLGGAALAALAVLGLVVLARAVIVSERGVGRDGR